jgi:hypothetical protein
MSDVTTIDCLRYPMLESNAKRLAFAVFTYMKLFYDEHHMYYFLIAGLLAS